MSVPLGLFLTPSLVSDTIDPSRDEQPCYLVKTHHRVRLTELASLLETNTFHVTQPEVDDSVKASNSELVYRFPLAENATLTSCVVELFSVTDGNVLRTATARICPRETAIESYDDFISEGSSGLAAVVSRAEESLTGSIFELSLGCVDIGLAGGLGVRVCCGIVQEVDVTFDETGEESGSRVLVQSSVQAMSMCCVGGPSLSGGVARNVTVEVLAELGCNQASERIGGNPARIVEILSPSHETDVAWKFAEGCTSKASMWTVSPISPDQDFIMRMEISDYPPSSWYVQKISENRYAHIVSCLPCADSLALEQPLEQSPKPRFEIFLIVDRSGSMAGERMQCAKDSLCAVLQRLKQSALQCSSSLRFNIVSFGSNHSALFPQAVEMSEKTYREALSHVEGMTANFGGTDIYNVVDYVVNRCPQRGGSPPVQKSAFLLTDGEDFRTEQVIQLVREKASACRFFCFGIGNGINPLLLDSVATASAGRAVFIRKNAEIRARVLSQVKHALQPCLCDAQIEFPIQVDAVPVAKKCSRMFMSQRQCSCYFSRYCPSESRMRFSYSCNGETRVHDLEPSFMSGNSGGCVGILAARSRIRALETSGFGKQEIRDLGMEMHLVTSETSLLLQFETNEESDDDVLVVRSHQSPMRLCNIPVAQALPPRYPAVSYAMSRCCLCLAVSSSPAMENSCRYLSPFVAPLFAEPHVDPICRGLRPSDKLLVGPLISRFLLEKLPAEEEASKTVVLWRQVAPWRILAEKVREVVKACQPSVLGWIDEKMSKDWAGGKDEDLLWFVLLFLLRLWRSSVEDLMSPRLKAIVQWWTRQLVAEPSCDFFQ